MDLNEYQKRAIVTDSFDTSKEIKITDHEYSGEPEVYQRPRMGKN